MVDSQGVIGNYVLERELGRGGMGVVYAATHRVLGRPAAIKVLLASTLEHRDRVERFFNEARAAMAIDHPGIVKTYDVGVDHGGRAYIAMELLGGSSLATRLRHGPLPLRLAVQFARQIADALAAAHRAGIVHRDLKPENIIVTAGEQLKLVDFGIAKLAQPATVRTATGAMMGTPLYMSPEQCEGAREVDARTDLYSLGCVLFAMLTGRPPFDGVGSGGVIGQHLHVPAPLLRTRCPAASPTLEGIVRCLLAKSRDERFRTASIVATALAAPEVIALSGPSEVAATADLAPPTRPAWTPAGAPPMPTGAPSGAGCPSVPAPAPYPPPGAHAPPGTAQHPSIATPAPTPPAGVARRSRSSPAAASRPRCWRSSSRSRACRTTSQHRRWSPPPQPDAAASPTPRLRRTRSPSHPSMPRSSSRARPGTGRRSRPARRLTPPPRRGRPSRHRSVRSTRARRPSREAAGARCPSPRRHRAPRSAERLRFGKGDFSPARTPRCSTGSRPRTTPIDADHPRRRPRRGGRVPHAREPRARTRERRAHAPDQPARRAGRHQDLARRADRSGDERRRESPGRRHVRTLKPRRAESACVPNRHRLAIASLRRIVR